ncbi:MULTISPECIES: hypothetical protein [Sphingomonas]|uniref:hypothetical protein n=1 Tax=Sphingomonas TaxID=13687 RepID=UPI000DEF830F|nr:MULTISPECIES: hypothetical protein [Sphingomonas]
MDAIAETTGASGRDWRLPRLGDHALILYRLIWALLVTVAILANLAGPYYNDRLQTQVFNPFSDLGLRQWDGRRLQVPHRPALERAGIVAGSEIVAIGGRHVAADASLEAVAKRLQAQPNPATVTIRRPDGHERTYRLQRSNRWIELSYVGTGLTKASRLAIDLAVAGIANVLLLSASTLLFWRRPRDGLAVLLALATATFAASDNLTYFTWRELGLSDLAGYVSAAATAALLLGMLLSPDGRFQPPWNRWVALTMVSAILFSFLGPLLGVPVWASILPFIGSFLAVLVAMRARFRATPSGTAAWQQQRWLVLGLGVAAVSVVATFILNSLAQTTLLTRQQLVWAYIGGGVAQSLVTLFIVAGMLVALLRYRLYDADAALSRSAGYAVVGLMFAALFAGFAKAIEIGMDTAFGSSSGAVPGIAAAVLATVVVTPAQSRIQNWADNRFRKALGHLRRDLPASVDDLRETASLAELLDDVLERVSVGVRATAAAIEMDGRIVAERGAAMTDWPLRLPLQIEHHHAGEEGWVLVGPRPDGSPLGKDEREALESVLDPVSRAIRIVRTREEREARQAALLDGIGRRLAALEARLA